MRYRMLLAALFCGAIIGASAVTAQAGPVPYDGVITMTAGETAQTNIVPLAAGTFEIDSIVFYNAGAVTAAVSVAASDIGVYTSLASYALSASGGSVQYPRRAEVAHTTTNAYRYVARDLRVISNKPTNATDVVIYYRVKFGN